MIFTSHVLSLDILLYYVPNPVMDVDRPGLITEECVWCTPPMLADKHLGSMNLAGGLWHSIIVYIVILVLLTESII